MYIWLDEESQRARLVVPKSMRKEVLFHCHDSKVSAHLGYEKSLKRLRQSYIWYQMAKDCKDYINACAVCNVNKKSCRRPKAALQMYHAGYPMERVHLDILGPFTPSESGNSYVLVMIDQFSKWIECVALPNQSADLVAREFFNHFVVTFGCPLTIHTDQGKNFDGNLFKELCEILQITKTRTTPYHPSSNGQVERYNRVIAQILRCYIEGKVRNWDKDLPTLVMALHASENKSTGYTPNKLMLGREAMLPAEIMMGVSQANLQEFEPVEWVQNLNKVLTESHQFARHHLASAQFRQKKDYDMKLSEKQYCPGDVVYKLDEATVIGQSRKLRPPWKEPYLVIGSEPPLYILKDNRGKSKRIHHDKLKLCTDGTLPLWLARAKRLFLDQVEPTAAHSNDDSNTQDDKATTSTGICNAMETANSDSDTSLDQCDADGKDDKSPTRVTRSGRQVKKPSYLTDFAV